MIYADNAATTKMSPVALAAMLPALEDNYGNPSSLHSVGQHAAELLQSAREAMARCLNCKPREILFTSGGSESDNQALLSAAELGRLKGKKHIISTAFEHHAVLHSLKRLEKQGFEVTLLPVGPTGHRYRPAGEGGHPTGYLSGNGDVRQQRDRQHPPHRGDRHRMPGGGRAVPHRRRTGGGTSAH